jgi:two-component system phosphate regulon sensor histidine kinase PhoR
MWNEPIIYVVLFILIAIWIVVKKRTSERNQRFIRSLSLFLSDLSTMNIRERFKPSHVPSEYSELLRTVHAMSDGIQDKWEYMKLLQDRLKVILDNMSNAVVLLDSKGYISYINPSGENLFGQSRVHLIGKSHWRIGRDSGISDAVDRVLAGEEISKQEILLPHPFGSHIKNNIMEMMIVPDRDEEQIHGAIIILHDITERKEMERLRKEFVANVSHELRTPLTAIQGYSETLMSGALDDRITAMDFLKVIHDESIRLHKMVNDLLDLSKLEHQKTTIHREAVDLEMVLQSVLKTVKLQAEEKKITLHSEGLSNVTVDGDRDLLYQLVINLVTNAIKYTEHGGEVSIQTSYEGDYAKMIVQDTGIGISQEHLPRLFERFYRVEASRNMASGGRGLGLSIVKHILHLHHGQIKVESEPRKGTKFTILLPISQAKSVE